MINIQLHIAGHAVYGDAWDTMRPAFVFLTTNGRTTTSKELTTAERSAMLQRLERTPPLWPRTDTSLHLWLDHERARAEVVSQS